MPTIFFVELDLNMPKQTKVLCNNDVFYSMRPKLGTLKALG